MNYYNQMKQELFSNPSFHLFEKLRRPEFPFLIKTPTLHFLATPSPVFLSTTGRFHLVCVNHAWLPTTLFLPDFPLSTLPSLPIFITFIITDVWRLEKFLRKLILFLSKILLTSLERTLEWLKMTMDFLKGWAFMPLESFKWR